MVSVTATARETARGAKPRHGLVLGIDAGGTRTRAALATAHTTSEDPDGGQFSTGAAGPGNALSVPLDRLTDHLREAIGAAAPPGVRPAIRAVVAGLAGCSALPGDPGTGIATTALRAALRDLGIRPRILSVHSDTEIAFASAPGAPTDGLVLVSGTGAGAARLTGGITTATADGNGWLLGDEGSGFWIGRRAVRAALAALDGRGAATLLTAAVRSHYLGDRPTDPPATPNAAQETRDRLVRAVHARPVQELAALSTLVADAAGQGDSVALGLLTEAVEHLAATLESLHPEPGDIIVTTGGLLGPGGLLLPQLERRLTGKGLRRPHAVPDGLAGAVAIARNALCGEEPAGVAAVRAIPGGSPER
jgi:N-acetylglucosamine kinase-like BadF-type ATPase